MVLVPFKKLLRFLQKKCDKHLKIDKKRSVTGGKVCVTQRYLLHIPIHIFKYFQERFVPTICGIPTKGFAFVSFPTIFVTNS